MFCFNSIEDASILRSIGLVKHPQVMSCIYITLFLVTMLIIAQQVNTPPHPPPTPFNLFPVFVPRLIKNRNDDVKSFVVASVKTFSSHS